MLNRLANLSSIFDFRLTGLRLLLKMLEISPCFLFPSPSRKPKLCQNHLKISILYLQDPIWPMLNRLQILSSIFDFRLTGLRLLPKMLEISPCFLFPSPSRKPKLCQNHLKISMLYLQDPIWPMLNRLQISSSNFDFQPILSSQVSILTRFWLLKFLFWPIQAPRS